MSWVASRLDVGHDTAEPKDDRLIVVLQGSLLVRPRVRAISSGRTLMGTLLSVSSARHQALAPLTGVDRVLQARIGSERCTRP